LDFVEYCEESAALLVGILNDDQQEFFLWSDDDFVLFTADPDESKVVLWVNVTDDRSCFCSELRDKTSVLDGG